MGRGEAALSAVHRIRQLREPGHGGWQGGEDTQADERIGGAVRALAPEDIECHRPGPRPDRDIGQHRMEGVAEPCPGEEILQLSRSHEPGEETGQGLA